MLSVTFLGTSAARPTVERNVSALALVREGETLLFECGDLKLLFPGDAQIENWEYALSQPDVLKLLRGVSVYKVGHHGSTNATPIPVVHAFGTNHSPNGFVAMCSTQPGVYGNPAKGTEVPRDPLMKALGDECTLVRSDAFDVKTSNGTVKAANGGHLPTPKVGKLSQNGLYVEYSF